MKKNICLHIITGLNTGGAEMMLYKLVGAMDRQSFTPVVVSLMDGGALRSRFVDTGIDVYSLGMKQGVPSFSSLFQLCKLLKRIKPDVIQGWMYHGNMLAAIAMLMMRGKPKLFWNIRQSLYDISKEKRLTAILIRMGAWLSFFPQAILYNSKVSCNQHESVGYHQNKSLFIPNGFNLEVFCPSTVARRAIRDDLGLDDQVMIGIIGRFHPMKDHRNFLEAASIVVRKSPDVYFMMAGKGLCRKNEELWGWVCELGLEKRVFLLGERSDIPQLNAAMNIAVLSSNSEAFPNVVGEAMACGTPCVVTDVGDAACVVGDTGLLVPSSDANALAHAMEKMIQMNEEERTRLGLKARQRIFENYSMKSVVTQYQNLYKQGTY